jgi:hypothetical protein
MRMPHFTKEEPATLQIVAPPAAARYEIRNGDAVVAGGALSNGVGRLELPGPLKVTVRVYDDKNGVVAERAFADLDSYAPAGDAFEPEVKGW